MGETTRAGDGVRAALDAGLLSEAEPGRRGEILRAAATVFADRGYEGGSMRRIADEVGVTEPALYRHFPGKEALFLALLRAAAARLRREGLELIGSVSADSLRTKIIAAFEDRRRAIGLYAPMARTLLTAVAHNPQFLPAFRDEIAGPIRQALAAKAADVDAALGIDSDEADRDARVRALMALMVGYFITSIVFEDRADETIADAAMRVMGWADRV